MIFENQQQGIMLPEDFSAKNIVYARQDKWSCKSDNLT